MGLFSSPPMTTRAGSMDVAARGASALGAGTARAGSGGGAHAAALATQITNKLAKSGRVPWLAYPETPHETLGLGP